MRVRSAYSLNELGNSIQSWIDFNILMVDEFKLERGEQLKYNEKLQRYTLQQHTKLLYCSEHILQYSLSPMNK